jgi:hypothetical protein
MTSIAVVIINVEWRVAPPNRRAVNRCIILKRQLLTGMVGSILIVCDERRLRRCGISRQSNSGSNSPSNPESNGRSYGESNEDGNRQSYADRSGQSNPENSGWSNGDRNSENNR